MTQPCASFAEVLTHGQAMHLHAPGYLKWPVIGARTEAVMGTPQSTSIDCLYSKTRRLSRQSYISPSWSPIGCSRLNRPCFPPLLLSSRCWLPTWSTDSLSPVRPLIDLAPLPTWFLGPPGDSLIEPAFFICSLFCLIIGLPPCIILPIPLSNLRVPEVRQATVPVALSVPTQTLTRTGLRFQILRSGAVYKTELPSGIIVSGSIL